MLVFFDSAGNQTGRFVVPSDPGSGANTVLFATQAFANLTGIAPDFIIPQQVMPIAGKVCFKNNPDNVFAFFINLCLSYGGAAFTGGTEGAGAANAASLSILGSQSLSRNTNFSFGGGTNLNIDFVLATPTPNSTLNDFIPATNVEDNTVGEAVLPTAASQAVQGENLFKKEAFLGNGRTCATCHIESESFGLPPSQVAGLPATDLLFMEVLNVNTLVVNSAGSVNPGAGSGTTQPSDFFLGDTLTGTLGGSATVLAGSGTTYLVHSGAGLDLAGNVISDGGGNTGTLVSFTDGDLDGPAPTGDPIGIEDSVLLNDGRALIVENINGFTEFSFRRVSPNLLNIKHTAPYGLSGEFADLQTFCAGAVQQHFPRSLVRVAGTDFRSPASDELAAMDAFMETIFLPADENFGVDNFVTTEAQKRGRTLFFGTAKCSVCHTGNVLATSDGTLGTTLGVNESFNTGVSNLTINTVDGLPTEQDVGQPANSRAFSTRPLFGVKNTAPFFHDSSVSTLFDAIQFYDTIEFRTSPAFGQVGAIDDVSIVQNAFDIEVFLNGLVDVPFTFTGSLPFGGQDVAAGASAPMTATIVNTGTSDLTILTITLNGDDPAEFNQAGASPDSGPFGNGEARTIDLTFDPSSMVAKAATLELAVSDGSDSWDVGVELSGTGSGPEPVIDAAPGSLAFGDRQTNKGPTAAQNVVITNVGSATLNLTSVGLMGGDAGEFNIVGDTGEASLAPAASRTVMIDFDPSSVGAKSADLRILSNDPDEGTVDVPLSGTGRLCVPNINLDGETVTGPAFFEACSTLTAINVSVLAPGSLILRAGLSIALGDGFSVGANATFTAEIDSSLLP